MSCELHMHLLMLAQLVPYKHVCQYTAGLKRGKGRRRA